ncbi:MAG: universal stress protein [Candidatus Micrarchaeia archaeon]
MRARLAPSPPLKKELGLFGSFSLGFADVGADIFLALGLIAAYAGGAMPFAILVAAFVYACTGLAYAELASAIPVAGGAASYGRRAFGDFVGFLGGWGLALDYLICIALFAVASAGYLSVLFPGVREFFSFATAGIILSLAGINLLGIRESSLVNTALTLTTMGVVAILLLAGFGAAFSLPLFLSTIQPIGSAVGWPDFLFSITLAMVTFIGIESISQAAEETREPGRIIPRASGLAVLLVVLFAVLVSVLALGIVPPSELAARMDNPLTAVALRLPHAGILVPLVAFAGFLICLVSANTGVIGVSRVLYSLSKANLISKRFRWVHPRYGTPWMTIIPFSAIALALAFAGDMRLLGELYAFGALLAYLIANVSLVALRIKEPALARPFRLGFNVRVGGADVPLIGVLGSLSCGAVFALVILLHEQGRIFAGLWFLLGIIAHFAYARYKEVAPELEAYLEERAMKGRKTVLVPLKLAGEEAAVLDFVAKLCSDLGASATLLHIVEVPLSVPLKEAAARLGEEEKKVLDKWKNALAKRGLEVVVAVRAARSASEGVVDFAEENEVPYIFLSKEEAVSRVVQEIEDSTGAQLIVYTR